MKINHTTNPDANPFPAALLQWLICILLCIASSSAFTADRALLIGINQYQSGSHLYGTHNDVNAVKGMLIESFGVDKNNIKLLLDEAATRNGILNAFDQWLIEETNPGDRVFFHYSGHGSYLRDQPGGDEEDGYDEVLVAHDAFRDANGVAQNMIRDDEINAKLAMLADRHVMVTFDSCHSGTMTRSIINDEDTDANDDDIRSRVHNFPSKPIQTRSIGVLKQHQKEGGFIKSGKNTLAFFAVSPNQVAMEYGTSNGQIGLYTTELVNAVRHKKADFNRDGNITLAELQEHVRAKSRAFCNRIRPGKCKEGLTPQLETELQMDFNVLDFGKAINVVSQSEPTDSVENILVHGNDAGLQVGMHKGNRVSLGDEVVFQLRSNKPGILLLFDINANDEVTQLFPNEYGKAKDAKMPAHVDIYIPDEYYEFDLPASEPVGKGLLVAVLVEDDIDINRLISVERGFAAVAKPNEWMNELRAQLNQLIHLDDGTNREVRWSITSTPYEIMP